MRKRDDFFREGAGISASNLLSYLKAAQNVFLLLLLRSSDVSYSLSFETTSNLATNQIKTGGVHDSDPPRKGGSESCTSRSATYGPDSDGRSDSPPTTYHEKKKKKKKRERKEKKFRHKQV